MDERELRQRANELHEWLTAGQAARDEAADARTDAVIEAIREQGATLSGALGELTRAVTALTAHLTAQRRAGH